MKKLKFVIHPLVILLIIVSSCQTKKRESEPPAERQRLAAAPSAFAPCSLLRPLTLLMARRWSAVREFSAPHYFYRFSLLEDCGGCVASRECVGVSR